MRVWILCMTTLVVACGRLGFDASSDDPDAAAEAAKVVPSQLGLAWVLPQTASLAWSRTGAEADFGQTRVVLGPTRLSVEERSSQTTVVDAATAPGLAFWKLPDSDAETVFVHLGELTSDARYFVQVEIEDADGAVALSEILEFETPPEPASQLLLFTEDPTNGYSIPSEFTYESNGARSGSFHYEFRFDCADVYCFENLRRQNVQIDMSPIPEDRFAGAYYEIFVEIAGTRPSYWSLLRLWFEPGTANETLYSIGDFTIAAGGYQRIQVPLSQLTRNGVGLSYADVQSGLFEWTVGGQWQNDTAIRVDDVSIHY